MIGDLGPVDNMTSKASCLLSFLSSTWSKVTIALIIVVLLVYSNRVDATVLVGLVRTWPWLLTAIFLMLLPFVLLSFRFKVILASQNIRISNFQVVRWTMIGTFFDLAMPSSCGGDLVKAGMLVKHIGAGQRTLAVVSIALDRIVGMLGLFLLASVAGIVGWLTLRNTPVLNLVVGLTIGASLGTLAFLRIAGSRRVYYSSTFDRVLSGNAWNFRIKQIFHAFNSLSEQPFYLCAALVLSVANHIFWCASLFCIAKVVGNAVDPVRGFVVFPLAIFSNIFGVAGGFGAGTIGFDFLLSQFLGIGNGALIGLMFQVLSAFVRLTGLPFYLFSSGRNNEKIPLDLHARGDEAEAAEQKLKSI